ncbi:probable glutamate receptor [Dreissena polymorpha]|nr:probable glutamate receptor [Dreissena polymorpha]
MDFPHYNISIAEVEPYIMKDGPLYKGYMVDLIAMLANLSNFTFTLHDAFNEDGRQPTGYSERLGNVIGHVVSQSFDIGLSDLMITEEASRAVYFTRPFSISGARILMLKPRPRKLISLMLLVPLDPELWTLLVCSGMLVGVLICVFNRFSRTALKNGVLEDLTIPVTCFISRMKDDKPLTTPSRLLLAFWRAFVLINACSYLANLASYIFSENSRSQAELPFKTFSDLTSQSRVSYGGWLGMQLNTHDTLQQKMLKYLNSQYSFYTDLSVAVEEIASKNGMYVAIVDGQAGEYLVNSDCRFLLLKDELYTIAYSIVCGKTERGRKACDAMSDAIIHLQTEGILVELKRKWWSQQTSCHHVSEEDFEMSHGAHMVKFEPMQIADVAVACILLFVGVCIAACIWVTQLLRRKRQMEHTDHSNEMDSV